MKAHWTLLISLLAATCSGSAADLPELILPQGAGVNIHFARGHERDLDLIAAAGFKFIRMDFAWGSIERRKGEYNWAEYDELTANLEKRGLRAIYILDYSNGLYEQSASPQHPESVAAFAQWAGAAAQHFKGRRIIWEIWNEPNISFWKPKPDVKQYITLAQATCRAVRENDPQATIIAPASSEFPWAFLEAMFQAGLLEQLDAVSVHPYRDYRRPPETAFQDYQKLRALIERYASPAKKAMPIISGEWGYASHDKGVSLETQAAFITRQQLANLWRGVPLSIWYDWKNDGNDPAYNEHNFGTVYPDLRPKPACEAVQVMTRELAGYRVARRLEAGSPEAHVLLLVNATGDQKLAAWSLAGERSAGVAIGLDSPENIAILSGKGQPQPVRLQQSRLELALSPLPQYITLKKPSRPLAAAAAWTVTPPLGIQAGAKDGLAIKVAVRNPFSQPVTASATLAGPTLSDRKTVPLAAGNTAEFTLDGTVSRRDLPEVPATLTLQLTDATGNQIGSCVESLNLRLANPLHLSLAPIGNGLRAILRNESASSFTGYIQVGNEKRPFECASTTNLATTDFSATSATHELDGITCRLTTHAGELVAEAQARKLKPLPAAKFLAKLDGDSKVSGTASVQEIASKDVGASDDSAPYAKVFALDYRLDEGWRFVRCEAEGTFRFDSQAKGFGLWVCGDNSGNSLRLRVRDASGQTFQPNGPNVDWTGWRWVTFDLQDLSSAGHWGGANDGVLKGNLSLDTALLLDSGRRKTAGRICFAGAAVIY